MAGDARFASGGYCNICDSLLGWNRCQVAGPAFIYAPLLSRVVLFRGAGK